MHLVDFLAQMTRDVLHRLYLDRSAVPSLAGAEALLIKACAQLFQLAHVLPFGGPPSVDQEDQVGQVGLQNRATVGCATGDDHRVLDDKTAKAG